MNADRYAEWDAAYVLGALPPGQRHEFEEHLSGCAECRQGVAELAAMPGLLAQIPAADAIAMATGEHPPVPPATSAPATSAPATSAPATSAPATSAPATSAATIRASGQGSARRGRLRSLALAAAIGLVALGGALGYGLRIASEPPAPTRLAFSSVVASTITAVVDLVPAPQGTEVKVECQYGGAATANYSPRYEIWVVDLRGHASEIKFWTVRPDTVMHPSALTPLPRADLSAVEIRDDTGTTVLRADVRA